MSLIGQPPKSQLEKRVDALEGKGGVAVLPTLYTEVISPLNNSSYTVKEGDYWLQIKDTTSKELVAFYVAEVIPDPSYDGALYFKTLYKAPSGGGGSGLTVNISYALVVDKEGVLSG